MMCPIRIDVDVNGTRYQDTLLLNAYADMLWLNLVTFSDKLTLLIIDLFPPQGDVSSVT